MKKLLIYIVTIIMYVVILVEAGVTGCLFSKLINKIDSDN